MNKCNNCHQLKMPEPPTRSGCLNCGYNAPWEEFVESAIEQLQDENKRFAELALALSTMAPLLPRGVVPPESYDIDMSIGDIRTLLQQAQERCK